MAAPPQAPAAVAPAVAPAVAGPALYSISFSNQTSSVVIRMRVKYYSLALQRLVTTELSEDEPFALAADQTNHVMVDFQTLRFPLVWWRLTSWNRTDHRWENHKILLDYVQPVQRHFVIEGRLYYEYLSAVRATIAGPQPAPGAFDAEF